MINTDRLKFHFFKLQIPNYTKPFSKFKTLKKFFFFIQRTVISTEMTIKKKSQTPVLEFGISYFEIYFFEEKI